MEYKFRYESADGKTNLTGDGKVFEQYTDGKYDEAKSELDIRAGPLKLGWSADDDHHGWINYQPEKLSVQIAHARDFEDRVVRAGMEQFEIQKLDLKRYMKK